jgi:hypothetical protein
VSALESPGIGPEGSRRSLSRLSVTVFGLLFAAGLAAGAAEYARRSPKIEQHVAGTNAITVHVLIAVAAAAAVVSVQARRSRQPARQRGPSPWAAPFSAAAASRLRRTIRLAGGLSLPNLARAAAAVPLVLLVLYAPFRMGMQVTGGLDPNATVNAWGGPTYLGALLAHYLDGTVGCCAAAFLLSRLLLPAAGGARRARPARDGVAARRPRSSAEDQTSDPERERVPPAPFTVPRRRKSPTGNITRH